MGSAPGSGAADGVLAIGIPPSSVLCPLIFGIPPSDCPAAGEFTWSSDDPEVRREDAANGGRDARAPLLPATRPDGGPPPTAVQASIILDAMKRR